jgi:hypothetical protein
MVRCRYPTNPVLRALTPQDLCADLQIFPVKLTQDAIMVDVSGMDEGVAGASTRGGADSSLERNNVYALQPRVYVEGAGDGLDQGVPPSPRLTN